MKNISKLIVVILIASLTSCEDAYQIEQVGLIEPENAILNIDDVEKNLNGVYSYLDNTTEIQFNGTYTDEFGIGNTNGGQNLDEMGLTLTSNSTKATSFWSNQYIAISQVNRLIAAANDLTIDTNDQARYNQALGQAYAIRAYLHLKLQTYFTTDYTDDNALGVILLDFVPGLREYYPRNTNGEVFTFINEDLDRADALLDNTANPIFMNKNTTNAMRARMAAYRGDYTTAATNATAVLAAVPNIGASAFINMLSDDSNNGVIFKLERTVGDSYDGGSSTGGGTVGSLFAFTDSNATGGVFLEMGRALFNKLQPSDVRGFTYIDATSIIDGGYANNVDYRNSDVLVINKYPGSEGERLMNDLKIFRSSEMLLILAEADANNATDLLGAATKVKQLRDLRHNVAQPLPVYANEQEAFADILAERRLELAFEGHRWIDLKRLGAVANVTIDKDPRDYEITGGSTLPIGDYRFTAPIPLREMDLNNLLIQNPNY